MCVQRQMIGKEIDVMLEQGRHALLAEAGNTAVFALPEPAVMHQDGVRPAFDGGVDQGLTCRRTTQDTFGFSSSFHLQTVWAIIAKARRLKQSVEIGAQIVTQHANS